MNSRVISLRDFAAIGSRGQLVLPVATGLLSACVLVLASTILAVGWGFGVDRLVRAAPEYAAMVPSTALCLILLSLATIRLHAAGGGERASVFAAIVAATVALASVVVRQAFHLPGIDSALLPETLGSDGTAFATSALTLAASYCLFHLAVTRPETVRSFTIVASIGLALLARRLHRVRLRGALTL